LYQCIKFIGIIPFHPNITIDGLLNERQIKEFNQLQTSLCDVYIRVFNLLTKPVVEGPAAINKDARFIWF